jgi:hypothetical protein
MTFEYVRSTEINRQATGAVSIPFVSSALMLTTATHIVHVWPEENDLIGSDRTGQVTVVFRGELYDSETDPAACIAQRVATAGERAFSDLDGSFVALVLDRRVGRAFFATDVIGSRRLFWAHTRHREIFSSSLRQLPLSEFTLDPVGVGWYLTHGAIHCGRTPFSEVKVLDRASVHEVAGDRVISRPYWSYDFTSANREAKEADLSAELASALVVSVRRQTRGSRLYLALTGGYDSCGIAGILADRLKIENVECFSYGDSTPSRGSDEYVASRVASAIGYRHRIIPGYLGNLDRHIALNSEIGEGFCHACEEADAWEILGEEFSSGERPAVLFGDECLSNDCRLTSAGEALASVGIGRLQELSWLSESALNVSEIRDSIQSDIQALLRRRPDNEDPQDTKDFFFLDQRLRNVHLPVREFFVAGTANVRNPLLGREVLEVMKRVPSRYRRGKRILHAALLNLCPRAFTVRRANGHNFGLDLAGEVRENRSALKAMLLSQPSRMDEIMPPQAVSHLLDLPFEPVGSSRANWHRLRAFGGRALRKAGLRGLLPPPGANSKAEVVLRRFLILRSALANTQVDPVPWGTSNHRRMTVSTSSGYSPNASR